MRRCTAFGLGAICALLVAVPATHGSTSDAQRQTCAARDLKVVTLLEQQGDSESLPPQNLVDVFFQIIDARRRCGVGRFDDAVSIYDRVDAQLMGASH